MNMFVWRLSKIPEFLLSFIKNQFTLKEMMQKDSQKSSKLFHPIQKSLKNQLISVEQKQIAAIEQIRKSWIYSNTRIPKWNNPEDFEKLNRLAKVSSKSKFWSTLIFNLIREFKPETCLELGTCIGISATYQASALRLNENGKLITLEGSPERAEIAQKNFTSLNLQNIDLRVGSFEENLEQVLHEYGKVDFLFMDGNHNYEATIKYFDMIFPFLADNSLIVIDDNYHSYEMHKAWIKFIEDKYVSSSINMFVLGILQVDKVQKPKTNYSIATLNFQ